MALNISYPNKLLLHHQQIIIHCQGSHPTVPAQQQSTREYRSSILKVRWNKPCGMVLVRPWCGPAGRAKRKASSLLHLGGLRGSAEGVHCSGLGLLHKKTAKFADGQQSQFINSMPVNSKIQPVSLALKLHATNFSPLFRQQETSH